MCPLVRELRARRSFETVVCVSGQHREMLDGVLKAFCVEPDYRFEIMKDGQSLQYITAAVLENVGKILDKEKPEAVLVHGDTSTAFASSLACFYRHIPVCHVEAGLRTHDILSPFPEEFNRRAISLTATYHFAPTDTAKHNLLDEGIPSDRIFVTGNTVLDALKYTSELSDAVPDGILDGMNGRRLVTVTLHRRENFSDPGRALGIMSALRRAFDKYGDDFYAVYPVHKSPQVRCCAERMLSDCRSVKLTEPLEVCAFHALLSRSAFVITDSGGIQEEATALGIPAAVVRDITERPEGVDCGTLCLVGTEEKEIYSGICDMFSQPFPSKANVGTGRCVFGDGNASAVICRQLEYIFN